ncbi:MAG: aminotransferase class V-fold PLP-dependent enzyme [Chloroflexota bacterium]
MNAEKPLDAYRELFAPNSGAAYLNHAALGRLSTRVVEALSEHISEHARLGVEATGLWKDRRERTRQKMAAFVGAEPSEIAFVKNTPEALSLVAAGLDWRPGDRVVISDQEFSANAFPWVNLRRKGVETTVVRSQAGRIPTEAVVEAIDRHTRLVSLSWVEFSTGYRNDIQTIGRACHERGAFLAVDAIQGLGVLPFHVRDLEVDFFGAASHKWLCGPTGVGWFFCRRELIERLDLSIVGQGSYERGSDTSWVDFTLPLWPDARRFEPGITNYLGVAGLEAALDLMAEVGVERVEAQVKHLTDLLAAGLLERGYVLAAPRDREQWSSIISFSSDRASSEDLLRRITAAGISVSLREGLIRVSPHFYNSADEIERLLAALP